MKTYLIIDGEEFVRSGDLEQVMVYYMGNIVTPKIQKIADDTCEPTNFTETWCFQHSEKGFESARENQVDTVEISIVCLPKKFTEREE